MDSYYVIVNSLIHVLLMYLAVIWQKKRALGGCFNNVLHTLCVLAENPTSFEYQIFIDFCPVPLALIRDRRTCPRASCSFHMAVQWVF